MDSLQDIFGPGDLKVAETPETTAVTSMTNNLDEFDDIFSSSTQTALPATAAAGEASRGAESTKGVAAASATGGDTAAVLGSDDFDNIFGDAPPAAEVSPSKEQAEIGTDAGDATKRGGGDVDEAGSKEKLSAGPGATASASEKAAGADREFLDFLYEDDGKQNKVVVAGALDGATSSAVAETGAAAVGGDNLSAGRGGTGEAGSPLEGGASGPEAPPASSDRGSSGTSSPPPRLDSIPLGSPTAVTFQAYGADNVDQEGMRNEPGDNPAEPPTQPPPLESYVRKERVEALRPLPDDPARALRELVAPEITAAVRAGEGSEGEGGGRGEEVATESTEDVGYLRRLCAATGGFLPPDLRPVVWSLLLGLGRRPEDAGFVKWREERRAGASSAAVSAAGVAYKLDLRNDCLALARRLCDSSSSTSSAVVADGEEGGEGKSAGGKEDPEALAVDIEEVRRCRCGLSH